MQPFQKAYSTRENCPGQPFFLGFASNWLVRRGQRRFLAASEGTQRPEAGKTLAIIPNSLELSA
jgi:hypothetical protein